MPIIKSAIKKVRVDEKRRKRNLLIKLDFKAKLKNIRREIEAKKIEQAKKDIVVAISTLDKAAKRHVIHKNKAARLKSRLMKKLNAVSGKAIELKTIKKPAEEAKTTPKKIIKTKKSSKKEVKKTTNKTPKISKKTKKK